MKRKDITNWSEYRSSDDVPRIVNCQGIYPEGIPYTIRQLFPVRMNNSENGLDSDVLSQCILWSALRGRKIIHPFEQGEIQSCTIRHKLNLLDRRHLFSCKRIVLRVYGIDVSSCLLITLSIPNIKSKFMRLEYGSGDLNRFLHNVFHT